MANAIIGALRVSLGLDSAEFSKGLSGAQGKLSDFDKRMRNLGGKIAAVGAAKANAVEVHAVEELAPILHRAERSAALASRSLN